MKSIHDEEGPLTMSMMSTPHYLLELREEIKALRAELASLRVTGCAICKGTGWVERRKGDQTIATLCECNK
jgi:hypothetical protein